MIQPRHHHHDRAQTHLSYNYYTHKDPAPHTYRHCPRCGTRISRYNNNLYCTLCTSKATDTPPPETIITTPRCITGCGRQRERYYKSYAGERVPVGFLKLCTRCKREQTKANEAA